MSCQLPNLLYQINYLCTLYVCFNVRSSDIGTCGEHTRGFLEQKFWNETSEPGKKPTKDMPGLARENPRFPQRFTPRESTLSAIRVSLLEFQEKKCLFCIDYILIVESLKITMNHSKLLDCLKNKLEETCNQC